MPADLPGKPGTPTVSASSSTEVTIQWTAGTDGGTPITDYKVYWDAGINGQVQVAASTTGNLLTFTSTSVTVASTYKFWVVALNFVGDGVSSDQVSVLAASVPATPAAPSVTATYNSVALTWVAPDARGNPIDKYDIYWDPDGNANDNFSLLHTETTNLFYTVSSGIV